MKRRTKGRYNSSFKNIIANHIISNFNIYFVIILILIIGICIGVILVNQLPDAQLQNINEYIASSIDAVKSGSEISQYKVLQKSLLKNILLVLIIWILGLTFLGNFLLYLITLVIGITFGYTISAIMTSFTFMQGILFFSTDMLLQNLIAIPSIIFLIIEGLKSRNEYISKQNNIKFVVIKYTILSGLVLILLFVSSIIETYLSTNLLSWAIKYL